jgi:biotin-dependent carboxylase-like uncharacterized protein
MRGMIVRTSGLLTTVQDLGRPGLGRFGVSVSGAMDPLALRVANLLVGNPQGRSCLEVTAVGPELELLAPLRFALTGGNLSPTLNGAPIETWQSHLGGPGDVLRFGARRSGARCYLAVAGAFVAPAALGSVSTDLESGLGRRPLRAGDVLEVGTGAPGPPRAAPVGILRQYSRPFELRFIPERCSGAGTGALATLTTSSYRVSPRSNRMGYRLEGPRVTVSTPSEPISEPIPPGTIQVPAGGEPILLMADRPTVGGYPRLGQVIRADLPRAAQLWIGHLVRFVPATLEEARQAMLDQEAALLQVEA